MKAVALLGVLALVGCGSARQATPPTPTIRDSLPQSQHTFHAANGRYSWHQVAKAFADQGIHLRNTTHFRTQQPWNDLEGSPTHAAYVMVENYPCKCIYTLRFPYGHRSRHRNVTVAYRPSEKPAVLAALRELH